MENETIKTIYERRSVRKYSDKKVPRDIIDKLLGAAVMAPSARNTQPWHFTIIEDRTKMDEIAEEAFKQYNLTRKNKIQSAYGIFFNAPLLIVISGKKDYFWLKDDVNLAVQNMFLAAHSLGLGSCWIGRAIHLNNVPEILEELGVPDDMEIVAPLIFGYPETENKNIPKREPKILKWIE